MGDWFQAVPGWPEHQAFSLPHLTLYSRMMICKAKMMTCQPLLHGLRYPDFRGREITVEARHIFMQVHSHTKLYPSIATADWPHLAGILEYCTYQHSDARRKNKARCDIRCDDCV